jgi:hypothetical protein
MEALYLTMVGINRQVLTTLLARRVERKEKSDHLFSSYLKKLIMPSHNILFRTMKIAMAHSNNPTSMSPRSYLLTSRLLMMP